MKEVERIIRVDHAGELGAISICRAQRMVARVFYKDIVSDLDDILVDEQQHFLLFDAWLKRNNVRPCYALWAWSSGGFVLGLITAVLGRKAIWVCTHAVETVVLHHLEQQLLYLKERDQSAYHAVLSIKNDEEQHQQTGFLKGSSDGLYSPIRYVVGNATKFAIWLSSKL